MANFAPAPALGDIVLCRFPQSVGVPGPKIRPALVIGVALQAHAVRVAYGTSKKLDRLYPTEFCIEQHSPGYIASGLSFPTKFDLARQVKLPFTTEWFAAVNRIPPPKPPPKLGVLHAAHFKDAQRAAIESERLRARR